MKILKKDIIEKEFTIDFKGYNAKEVDLFLDLIATNYELLEQTVANLQSENETLKVNLARLQTETDNIKAQMVILKQQKQKLEAKGVENVDIITRLSKLESIVHED